MNVACSYWLSQKLIDIPWTSHTPDTDYVTVDCPMTIQTQTHFKLFLCYLQSSGQNRKLRMSSVGDVSTVKGSRTRHFVKVSLWYASLLTNTRFRFLYFRIIVKRIWCYIKTKSFQKTQGGFQVIIILPIKSKMAAAKKQCFLRFLYWNESSLPSFKVRGLQMTINLALV